MKICPLFEMARIITGNSITEISLCTDKCVWRHRLGCSVQLLPDQLAQISRAVDELREQITCSLAATKGR